jgi:hypothetical protein
MYMFIFGSCTWTDVELWRGSHWHWGGAKFLVAHFLLAFMSPIAVAGFLDVNYNVT